MDGFAIASPKGRSDEPFPSILRIREGIHVSNRHERRRQAREQRRVGGPKFVRQLDAFVPGDPGNEARLAEMERRHARILAREDLTPEEREYVETSLERVHLGRLALAAEERRRVPSGALH